MRQMCPKLRINGAENSQVRSEIDFSLLGTSLRLPVWQDPRVDCPRQRVVGWKDWVWCHCGRRHCIQDLEKGLFAQTGPKLGGKVLQPSDVPCVQGAQHKWIMTVSDSLVTNGILNLLCPLWFLASSEDSLHSKKPHVSPLPLI